MKFWFFKNYWWILPVVLVVGLICFYMAGISIDFKVVSAVLGTFISSIYFVQKQKLEEIKLFREIFSECNQRYDDMNEEINNIIRGDDTTELTNEEKDHLDDYFNLCGEEYLYFKQGYIYPDVWTAWLNGMRSIIKDDRVYRHWCSEKETGSFYGLPL